MKNSVFFVLLVGLCSWGIYFLEPKYTQPSFLTPPPAPSVDSKPYLKINDIEKIPQAPSVHSSSIAKIDNGNLLAVWFGGSGEGKRDVQIYGSTYNQETKSWSKPKSYLDRYRLMKDSKQFIKKLGNPSIYTDSSGKLHLFVVGVSLGGWATSKIYHYSSVDYKNFEYVQELKLGPFANLSHLVRSNAVGLDDGGFYLPIYHELADKFPLIVRFDTLGRYKEQKLTSTKGQLQPSIAVLDSKNCVGVFRNYYKTQMLIQRCKDGGQTWLEPIKSNIINDNNSASTINFYGNILLVANTFEENKSESRGTLTLFYLDGDKFRKITTLDVAEGIREGHKSVEVSYPNSIVDGEYMDIVYTHNRVNIRHIRFNKSWLDEKLKSMEF